MTLGCNGEGFNIFFSCADKRDKKRFNALDAEAFLFRQSRRKEVRQMTWLKKDQEVLGYEVEEPDSKNILETNHYHKGCFAEPAEGYSGKITGYVTKETLGKSPDNKLLCDCCGEEIKA